MDVMAVQLDPSVLVIAFVPVLSPTAVKRTPSHRIALTLVPIAVPAPPTGADHVTPLSME